MSENALAEWIPSHYALKEPLRCRFLRGSMSDVYRVDSRDACFILKIYLHKRHPRRAIEAEVEFLNDLLGQGIPVSAPVANLDSAFVNEIAAPEGVRYAVLFEALPGTEPQEENLAHSHAFGELAGRIHHFADASARLYDRSHLDEQYLVEEPLAQLYPYLEHRPQDWETLCSLGRDLSAELIDLLPKAKPEYGICHGDLHTGNARITKDGRLALFDFDSFGYGWRAIDLGVYPMSFDWMSLSEETRQKKDRFWDAFLDGYSTQRTLSQNELAAVGLCPPLRHLELMGLTIRYWSPQIGTDWINDEYFDRHLAWFREWVNLRSKPPAPARHRSRRS